MNKDQATGEVIFSICILIAVLYAATLFFPSWLGILGVKATHAEKRYLAIAAPVFIAFIAVMAVDAWIGWTMATTPSPKPIEEVTGEIREES